jgi:hypothetical protein
MGAAAGLVEVRSRLELTAAETRDTAVAAGYRLVRWTDAAPEEFLDDLGELDSRLNLDAPVGDLAWEPQQVDAAGSARPRRLSSPGSARRSTPGPCTSRAGGSSRGR